MLRKQFVLSSCSIAGLPVSFIMNMLHVYCGCHEIALVSCAIACRCPRRWPPSRLTRMLHHSLLSCTPLTLRSPRSPLETCARALFVAVATVWVEPASALMGKPASRDTRTRVLIPGATSVFVSLSKHSHLARFGRFCVFSFVRCDVMSVL